MVASTQHHWRISMVSVKLGDQLTGPRPSIHFCGNLQFKKSVTSSWKCGSAPSCWNSISSRYFKNTHVEFLQPVYVHYTSHNRYGIGKDQTFFSLDITQNDVQHWNVSCMCPFISTAAPQKSQVILLLFDSYSLVFCGAPTLTRGRVCHLHMLLALASTVFLGSESLGTSYHNLLSRIWDVPFCHLLRLTGSQLMYFTLPPYRFLVLVKVISLSLSL
jgi:hypothetical protein